jgi:predicted Fe-S protein YdhL (DUF1289 family)
VHVCTLDAATGLCRGCSRTLDEIARWSTMSEADRLHVWAQIRQRRDGCATRPPAAESAGGRRE